MRDGWARRIHNSKIFADDMFLKEQVLEAILKKETYKAALRQAFWANQRK